MRRFARLINAFSKKVENHISALALYFVYNVSAASTKLFASLLQWKRESQITFGASKRL